MGDNNDPLMMYGHSTANLAPSQSWQRRMIIQECNSNRSRSVQYKSAHNQVLFSIKQKSSSKSGNKKYFLICPRKQFCNTTPPYSRAYNAGNVQGIEPNTPNLSSHKRLTGQSSPRETFQYPRTNI